MKELLARKVTVRILPDPFTLRDLILLLIIAHIVGFSFALSMSYVQGGGEPVYDLLQTVLLAYVAIVVFAAFAVALDWLYGRLEQRDASTTNTKPPSKTAALTPSWNAKSVSIFTLIMLLCWLPWVIANFPAATDLDMLAQVLQLYPEGHPLPISYTGYPNDPMTDAQFVDHHPLFDTLIFGAFAVASDALTGSWNAGIFAYALIQEILTAVALVAGLALLKHAGCPSGITLAAFLFLCFMPAVPNYAFYMTKDSLYTLFFIPYFYMLFRIVRTPHDSHRSRSFFIFFVLLGVLLCLTKKTGFYIIVPTALFAIIFYRRQWKLFLTQAVNCLVIMHLVLPFLVFPLLNVAPGGKQEAIGLMLQQTAAFLRTHPSDYSVGELRAIEGIASHRELYEYYEYMGHDHAKWAFNHDSTTEDFLAYVGAYVTMGLKDPEIYLSAFLGVAGQYLAPVADYEINTWAVDRHLNDLDIVYGNFEGDEQPEYTRTVITYPPELDGFRHGLSDFWKTVSRIPVIGILFQMVLYVFWIPCITFYVALRRRLHAGLLFVPIFLTLAACLIGPVYSIRYCLPMLDLAIPLFGMLAILVKAKAHSSSGYEKAFHGDGRPYGFKQVIRLTRHRSV